jgi:imidazolonepropionase-like amidohydrolase
MHLQAAIAILLAASFSLAAAGQAQSAKPARRGQSKSARPYGSPSGISAMPAGGAAGAPTIVLRGGKLLTITHGVIENGVLIMQGGKIAAVGAAGSVGALPRNAQVIDVSGMTVYPGLIDSETRLGLVEVEADPMTVDTVETSDEIMPHMHVSDAFHGESALIPVARYNGITNAIVAPAADDTLPGQDSFIQLAGRNADDMLLARDIAMPLNFTGDQRRNESFEKAKFPFTRMGMAAQLRQSFLDAQDYARKWSDFQAKQNKPASSGSSDKGEPEKSFHHDLKLEALLPYLEGKKPVVLAAEEPNDLQTALSLANEFHLKVILNHISHSGPILDQIAALKLPVIVGPLYTEPHDDERYDAVYKLPGELVKRGVKIAFASYNPPHNSRNLPYAAGFAVVFGLPYDEALKAITLNPAEIWGLGEQLGSLDAGKVANVVVANGDPLDMKTDVKRVFIAGREIPMVNRQTELRDEYSK